MIRTIEFSLKGQQEFADLSGDFNPIHLDSVYARRTIWGRVAVHGINQLLTALDMCLDSCDSSIVLESVKAEFLNPLYPGERCEMDICRSENSIEIKIKSKTS